MEISRTRVLFSGMEWFPEHRDGGSNRYFYEQLQAMAAAGVAGEAMVSSARPGRVGQIAVHGMAAGGARLISRWRGARALARRALDGGARVVNVHFALYAWPWLNLLSGTAPLIVTFHGPWAEEMRLASRTWSRRVLAIVAKNMEKRVYRRADRVITLSEAFKKLIHEQYGVPLGSIRVIPGGIDLQRYLAAPERAVARDRLGWPADRVILLAVRRLTKRMGLDLLVEAVARIQTEFPKVLLYIGGEGPESDALRTQIASKGLEEHVRLTGFLPEEDLPFAYAAADLSVVPTVALEGFGLVTAESLACGTPVLGTPVGGTPEVLMPLDRNLVFDAATPEAMARRIGEVLRGSKQLPDRAACRAYVKRYGWVEVLPKILSVYQEAIAERDGRTAAP